MQAQQRDQPYGLRSVDRVIKDKDTRKSNSPSEISIEMLKYRVK